MILFCLHLSLQGLGVTVEKDQTWARGALCSRCWLLRPPPHLSGCVVSESDLAPYCWF